MSDQIRTLTTLAETGDGCALGRSLLGVGSDANKRDVLKQIEAMNLADIKANPNLPSVHLVVHDPIRGNINASLFITPPKVAPYYQENGGSQVMYSNNKYGSVCETLPANNFDFGRTGYGNLWSIPENRDDGRRWWDWGPRRYD
jgi:hypothetical protein